MESSTPMLDLTIMAYALVNTEHEYKLYIPTHTLFATHAYAHTQIHGQAPIHTYIRQFTHTYKQVSRSFKRQEVC